MASLSKPPPFVNLQSHSHYQRSPFALSFSFCFTTSFDSRLCALNTGPDSSNTIQNREGFGSDFLRKPIVVSAKKELGRISEEEDESVGKRKYDDGEEKNWEDKILEVTVPLVGFVRMILHSGKYGSGDRLSPEHEKIIIERLLPFHPEFEKKIGCGIDYIMVDYHPDFESSRCLFIVQKDGKFIDFSYWKCIQGLIRKNYPLYAESFIFKHFRRHRRKL